MAFNPQCLKDVLEETPLTYKQLAECAGVSEATIHQYMRGTTQPTVKTLIKLADFLAIPLDILVGRCTEDQYKAIMDDYHKQFMQLRRAPYSAYILKKSGKPNFLLTPNDMHDLKMEAPWPNNLVDQLCCETVELYMDEDHIKGLNKALNTLCERERQAIHLYFEEGLTLEKTAKVFNVTRERARQILAKALRKLRHPSKFYFILYGETGAMQKLQIQTFDQQIAQKKKELNELTEAIEKVRERLCVPKEAPTVETGTMIDLFPDISVRAYNCLRREGCETVNDIIFRFEQGKVHKIRNFGLKSCKEVLDLLHNRYNFTMSFEEVW